MKTNITHLVAVAACLLLAGAVRSQDIHFSQFNMSPLTLNPAMAGAQNDLRATFNYRDQWKSVGTPYRTIGFGCDSRLNKKKSTKGFLAAGINFFSDRSGDAKMGTVQANLSLAYHVRLGLNSTLGGGLVAGFAQRSVNYMALQWGSQYDGSAFNSALASGEPVNASTSISYADFGGGLLWNYDNRSGSKNVTDNHDLKANFGVSFFHLSQPGYSFYANPDEKLFLKTVVHGSALFSISNSNVAFVPSFMYSRQGPAQEIYAGTLLRFTVRQDSKYTGFKDGAAISAGAFMRTKDAVVAQVLLEYSNYAIGISYDVNTSPLRTASNSRGGLEIALRFVTPNPFATTKSAGMFN